MINCAPLTDFTFSFLYRASQEFIISAQLPINELNYTKTKTIPVAGIKHERKQNPYESSKQVII
jgi:hypothetical protein